MFGAVIDDMTGEIVELAQKGKQTAAQVAKTTANSSTRTMRTHRTVAQNIAKGSQKNIRMAALVTALGAGTLGYNLSRRRNR
jgi:hypothetical protein